ncbi:hypothetical protein FJT64_019338 [Amphibalanus amphitrite]|uniref:C2H2-type domain-containing protein n=1 Tax=Amphibalanus amphitrite TaxID=1232801 RepID=A0A6A4WW91_AMPAM|nr:hypothetical protein FJT64_019338 [Amphibalanus amphitrite]
MWCAAAMSQFVPKELVWVKLGGVQWPAVVKDKTDPECEEFLEALKRDPIVVVEFFDKKLHDVHNTNQICRYNCEEKDDIVLKSLQLTRNKSDIAEDFKKDIITAEKLTDGDIHILSREKFSMTGRQKYDELFGSGRKSNTSKAGAKRKIPRTSENSPKLKTSKYSDLFPEVSKSRKPVSKPKKPAKPASESPRPITHPRFIAENDHKIHILAPDSPEARTVAPSLTNPYRCSECGFTTGRLNVLVIHNKSHVAAAAAKPATAKRKNNAEPRDSTPKKKKRPADGSTGKVAKAKVERGEGTPKKLSKPSPKKSAPSTPKKSPKKEDKVEEVKPKTPVKLSPLKPAQSSRPLLLEDWDEDDDEEEAERAKIRSEIERFICDKKTPTKMDDASGPSTSSGGSPAEASTDDATKLGEDTKDESVDVEPFTLSENDAERVEETEAERAKEADAERTDETDAERTDETEPSAAEPPSADDEEAAKKQAQRERNDALLQAAVDDVLAETAPVALPTLPPAPADQAALSTYEFTGAEPEPVPARPRPVRVCPAGSPPPRAADAVDVTSSRPTPTSSADGPPAATATSSLPPNLQILSVPGTDGQPDTYVLVSVDERGNVQTVNPLENLGGLGADTLLAYEVAQEDGSTRTAYLNPASLSTSADIKQLLGADEKVDSTTQLPDSSGK